MKELRKLMFEEIGYAYCYMNFWHKDIFSKHPGQKRRVKKLITSFTENEHEHDILWYQEQVFLFQNETENMC